MLTLNTLAKHILTHMKENLACGRHLTRVGHEDLLNVNESKRELCVLGSISENLCPINRN